MGEQCLDPAGEAVLAGGRDHDPEGQDEHQERRLRCKQHLPGTRTRTDLQDERARGRDPHRREPDHRAKPEPDQRCGHHAQREHRERALPNVADRRRRMPQVAGE
jgi:hypothetical protein